MIIWFPRLDSTFLARVSLLLSLPTSWIPLCCAKFSCVGSVCSHINVIYITALPYRQLLEHTLKRQGCRRAEFVSTFSNGDRSISGLIKHQSPYVFVAVSCSFELCDHIPWLFISVWKEPEEFCPYLYVWKVELFVSFLSFISFLLLFVPFFII